MHEEDVRASAELVGAALVAGDVDTAIGYLSDELKRNLGEVVALLPLPAMEATIESIERGRAAFVTIRSSRSAGRTATASRASSKSAT
jgi:hypothetical protein